MQNKELLALVKKTDISPDPETELIIDCLVEMALKCNPANKIIIDIFTNPEAFSLTPDENELDSD